MNDKTYQTLAGLTVAYSPNPAVAAFVSQLAGMAVDPAVTEDQLVAAVYGTANPLMDTAAVPGRGAVTAAVLADPAYRVMTDLLFRKHVAQHGVDVGRLAARYTLTVAEAAARLGVTTSAVRQAIDAGRLGAWVRDGQIHVDPDGLAALKLSPRGPKPQRSADEPPRASAGPLRVRAGSEAGHTLHVRSVGQINGAAGGAGGKVAEGEIQPWRRVAVLTHRADGRARLFVLEPVGADGGDEAIDFGPLYVRGRFAIVEKVNGDRAARAAWKAFEPA